MINLTKAPFFLVKEDIEWVENTKKAMTLEEKIGQLFVPIGYSGDADYLEHVMLSHHIGGIMYRCGEAKEMQRTHRYLQEHSKIPLLVGANLEDGGCGIATDGTQYGKQMQIAATGDTEDAYRLGKVSCSEGARWDVTGRLHQWLILIETGEIRLLMCVHMVTIRIGS